MPETAADTDHNFDATPELFADMTKTDIVHVLEYLHFPKNAQRPDQNRQAGARLLDQPAFRAGLIRSCGCFWVLRLTSFAALASKVDES